MCHRVINSLLFFDPGKLMKMGIMAERKFLWEPHTHLLASLLSPFRVNGDNRIGNPIKRPFIHCLKIHSVLLSNACVFQYIAEDT